MLIVYQVNVLLHLTLIRSLKDTQSQIERERVNSNDQRRRPTTGEISQRPREEQDVQAREKPAKTQGKGRSQRSNPRPSPNTIGSLKGPKRPQCPATLGQTLAQNPQAQATTCRRRRLVRTSGGEAQTQGQTPQRHNAMAWLDITREGELKSKERSSWNDLQTHNDPSQPMMQKP